MKNFLKTVKEVQQDPSNSAPFEENLENCLLFHIQYRIKNEVRIMRILLYFVCLVSLGKVLCFLLIDSLTKDILKQWAFSINKFHIEHLKVIIISEHQKDFNGCSKFSHYWDQLIIVGDKSNYLRWATSSIIWMCLCP